MLKKKARVYIPASQESPYITRCPLIGLLLAARQINQPMKASDRTTAMAVNI